MKTYLYLAGMKVEHRPDWAIRLASGIGLKLCRTKIKKGENELCLVGVFCVLLQVVFQSKNKASARSVDRGTFLMNVFLCFASINS